MKRDKGFGVGKGPRFWGRKVEGFGVSLPPVRPQSRSPQGRGGHRPSEHHQDQGWRLRGKRSGIGDTWVLPGQWGRGGPDPGGDTSPHPRVDIPHPDAIYLIPIKPHCNVAV